jgi:hypothetical protein
MDRLQLLRTVLMIFSTEDAPSLLLETAASALLPHVPHLRPKHTQMILHLCARCGFKHTPLCLALASHVVEIRAKLSPMQRKAIAADFVALGWLAPGLSEALGGPCLAGNTGGRLAEIKGGSEAGKTGGRLAEIKGGSEAGKTGGRLTGSEGGKPAVGKRVRAAQRRKRGYQPADGLALLKEHRILHEVLKLSHSSGKKILASAR